MGVGELLSNMIVYPEMYLTKSGCKCYTDLLCPLMQVGWKGAGVGECLQPSAAVDDGLPGSPRHAVKVTAGDVPLG